MVSSEIPRLRIHISTDTTDARSMALLANLLMERAKSSGSIDLSSDDDSSNSDQEEAISLAKTSINLAPEDAIGYAVLSTIPKLKFRERMEILRTAVNLENKKGVSNASSQVAVATSLLRLLIEPREELTRNKDRLTAKKIMRHDFTVNSLTDLDEKEIYEELKIALEDAKSIIWKKREERWQKQQKYQELQNNEKQTNLELGNFSLIPHNIQCLARAHYRLGTFFRTINPHSTHRSKSEHHFYSILDLLNPPHMNESFDLKSQSEMHDLAVKSKFWLAALQQGRPQVQNKSMQVDRCPSEYVISLYSGFAANFDNLLVNKLKYQTPTKLRHIVNSIHQSEKAKCFSRCADLGCGTGLSGVAFRDLVGHLSGIDLSPEMIDKAKERKIYDLLRIGDVESILTDPDCDGYDLVIACDVFVYIGDLQSVFQTVSKHITSHGLFAFSTELLDEKQSTVGGSGFMLQSCARFAHKESYLRNLAKDCGFLVKAMTKDVIRKNGGEDVNGFLAVLSLE